MTQTVVRPVIAVLLALSLMLSSAPMAEAKRKVYSGSEAEALKCSYLISMTALLLWKAGKLSTRDKDRAMTISVIMMNRYVSGTWEQKKKALTTVGNRRSLGKTVKEFQQQSKYCIRRFPVK